MEKKHINISDYNYDLPDERIAKYPLSQRDSSKLLIYKKGVIAEDKFFKISEYLPENGLMIFNNTKVIQARLHFTKDTGAQIEVFLLEPAHPNDYEQMFQAKKNCSWYCLVGNLKKWKDGTLRRTIIIDGKECILSVTKNKLHGTSYQIDFSWDAEVCFADMLDAVGELPIPPYLNRATEESDKTTYQTVYSKIKGSVAAPTAGLHFTDTVLKEIESHGIERDEITLHVGAGTFRPVKVGDIADHNMHTEFISVNRDTIKKLINYGATAIAVGTTSVRTLESLYYLGVKIANNPEINETELHVSQWEAYSDSVRMEPIKTLEHILLWMDSKGVDVMHASTQIIIAPGYDYKIVKMLITNFHQPQSTLLLLVSAFVNSNWRTIYNYALAHDFRFLSYGDSSLLIP